MEEKAASKAEEKVETVKTEMKVMKKKRENKIRRRDSRALENLLKPFSSLTDGEKFIALKYKYGELYDEYRKLQNQVSDSEKKAVVLQRERDHVQSEYSKSVLAKSRLEGLCRELQKQNKIIKDEHMAKIREEEESRKQVAAKFESTLTELTTVMQDSSAKNLKLLDDNLDMANKIDALYKKFEKAQEDLVRMEKQMSLEKQLSEATYNKLQLEFAAEREQWGKERDTLQKYLQQSEENCQQFQSHMKVLEGHLSRYTGKFETTLSKSSQVFDDCKSEIAKMTKQINALERELKIWKTRGERNAKTVIELTAVKQLQDAELTNSEKKVEQLQKLCRQLQVDRASYLKLLKTNGIEPSSQICIDSSPVTPPAHKPTKKEQELQQLKDNLKVLKAQFQGLTGNTIDDKGNEVILDENGIPTEELENQVNEESIDALEEKITNESNDIKGPNDIKEPNESQEDTVEMKPPIVEEIVVNSDATVVSNGTSTNL